MYIMYDVLVKIPKIPFKIEYQFVCSFARSASLKETKIAKKKKSSSRITKIEEEEK